MTMTPYEWSLRADGSDNQFYPMGSMSASTPNNVDGSTLKLGDTAFKVTFASGYDPDYYAKVTATGGLDWDYFKTAGVFTAPNPNTITAGVPAAGVATATGS